MWFNNLPMPKLYEHHTAYQEQEAVLSEDMIEDPGVDLSLGVDLSSEAPGSLIRGHAMRPGEEQRIKLDGVPLVSGKANKLQFGRTAPTLAEINAGGQLFTLLDMRGRKHDAPLMLVDATYNAITKTAAHKGYKNIRDGDTVAIGRNHFTDRFAYSPAVSREHFEISLKGLKLIVRNKQPTNTTILSGDIRGLHYRSAPQPRPAPSPVPRPPQPVYNIRDQYTRDIYYDAGGRHDFGVADSRAVYGYHKNHPIIGRETNSVRGGVYFTTNPMTEAVVVDDKSAILQNVAGKLTSFLETTYGSLAGARQQGPRAIARIIERYSAQLLIYDLPRTMVLCDPYKANNDLIGLSDFVKRGYGVCRHQCLLAAFFMETLIARGVLEGSVAVERNIDHQREPGRQGHAWAVLHAPTGTLVIDPAQRFVGTKEEAKRLGGWRYQLNS